MYCINKKYFKECIIKISKPKVLVLLTVYNGRSWLDEQLRSIFKQEDIFLELVISDDNSNDGSQAYLKNLIKEKPHLKITFKKKGSGSAGQNFFSLIRNCNLLDYDYVAFSDQDDIWLPNKLSSGIDLLEASSACAYSSSATAFWPSGNERTLKQSNLKRSTDYLFEGAGQGCTFIMKRDFFSKVQIFCRKNRILTDRFYYHDWLIYILARSWKREWIFDAHSYIRYRQHGLNDTGARKGIESIKSRVNLIANGWYKKQVGLAIQIANAATTDSLNLSYISDIFWEKDTLRRRIKLIIYVVENGRRKSGDRLILVLAVLLGWL